MKSNLYEELTVPSGRTYSRIARYLPYLMNGNLLFNNWLNYFVYQETPYDKTEIKNLGDIIRLNE